MINIIEFRYVFLICVLSTFSACYQDLEQGTGDLITETRIVKDFHALEVDCNGIVEVRTGSTFKVEVTCEETIIDRLETIEDNGVLKIFFDRTVWDVDGLKIKVTAPSWDGFEVNGSADIRVLDSILEDDLNLTVSGSGDIDLSEVDFLRIFAKISGSGDVVVRGIADELRVSISGSGKVDALDCPVKKANASVSGSGDAYLHVTDELDASVSGSGNIRYKGNPTSVQKSVSGSGTIKKL